MAGARKLCVADGRRERQYLEDAVNRRRLNDLRKELGFEIADRVRVTIRDNGVGFSPGQLVLTRDRRGLGLLGSAERLHGLGGLFEVTALPAGGTLVTAEAPHTASVLELPHIGDKAR